jgi:hypothetical protein
LVTRGGVLAIQDLLGGEHEFLTDGGCWTPGRVKPVGITGIDEVILSRSKVLKTLRVSENFSWWIRRSGLAKKAGLVSTRMLLARERLAFAFAKRPPVLEPVPDAVARGFVYGDGSLQAGRAAAYFCGAKDGAMLPLFAKWGPPRTYGSVKRICGLPPEWKRDFPTLRSEADELYGWLAGYFAADGDVDKSGRPTLASASRANLEFVRSLGRTIGIGTFGIRMRLRKGYGLVETPLYLLGLMRGDLSSSFFFIPAHRARFEAGRKAAERRGWSVVSCTSTKNQEETFRVEVGSANGVVLEDNILVPV